MSVRTFAAVLLAGCNGVFGLTVIPPEVIGDAIDGECLRDDFDDNDLNAGKWSITDPDNTPIVVSERQQHLNVSLAPNQAGDYISNSLASIAPRDMTDAQTVVEVVATVSFAGGGENFLTLQQDAQNAYAMSVGGQGTFNFAMYVDGVRSGITIFYDPVVHRHWRIRHDAASAMVHFETSPDRVSWASQWITPASAPVTHMTVVLGAGSFQGGSPNPGAAVYDDLQFVTGSCPLR